MTTVTSMKATTDHALELIESMRAADMEEVHRLGLTPSQAVLFSIENSEEATAVLFDGKVAAIYGVSKRKEGNAPDRLWCLTSTVVDSHPLTFWRESKAVVKRLSLRERTMFAFVDSAYNAAMRWTRMLGFLAQKTVEINGNKFSLVVRRTSWASK